MTTFEQARQAAFRHLSDAADELRSDWSGTPPSARQAVAVGRALILIEQAKGELDRASRRLIDEDLDK